jgi:hypothetical protein
VPDTQISVRPGRTIGCGHRQVGTLAPEGPNLSGRIGYRRNLNPNERIAVGVPRLDLVVEGRSIRGARKTQIAIGGARKSL